jgi:NhaA family Na+:H+ antiporter
VLLGRGSWPETQRIASILRSETVGGLLLLAAASLALVWANTPWAEAYRKLRDTVVGPSLLHLDLTLGTWAADGLLAIFFFVAGLELKREFVAGDLRDPWRAAIPVAAAVGGVVVPALAYAGLNSGVLSGGDGDLAGWAVPTATDIAFALAILAVLGSRLPAALRTFLLTLAVVDDLLAITIIAVFYTDDLSFGPLALALLPLAAFTFAVQRGTRAWWMLLPLALATWVFVHESGVHATVAGVLLGLVVPVRTRPRGSTDTRAQGGIHALAAPGGGMGLAEHLEHRWRPLSASVAVPVFAFSAAGVTLGGADGLRSAAADPVAYGVVVALVVGKPVGVLAATWLVARLERAQLDPDLSWWDVFGLALLAGIGFTVSLLIGELAFGTDTGRDDRVKVAVLVGSLAAAALAATVLRARTRVYRNIAEAEARDEDRDGTPDIYER